MRIFYLLSVLCLYSFAANAQQKQTLTLEQVISIAQNRSIDAMVAKNKFLSEYWNYRAYAADLLPSLNLKGNIANFDRSLKALQNSTTGEISYIENYNMYNRGALSIDQNISATGGKISLYSSLERLDQYSPTRNGSYYTQPITLSYIQPLWTYNSLKWDKKIEPEKFEQAKRVYLESMERVTVRATTMFFDALLSKIAQDMAASNYSNTSMMYDIAKRRFELGSMRKNEILQLELRMLNDSMAIKNSELEFISRHMALNSFLGFKEHDKLDLIIPESVPDIVLDYNHVVELALNNSSFILGQKITELESERKIAMAKGSRGVKAQINTQFGVTGKSSNIPDAYKGLLDAEIVGLTFSVPIVDWGLGRGRVKVAQAQKQTSDNQLEQAEVDYRQDILIQVFRFNTQKNQCAVSLRARAIANERHQIAMESFVNGVLSVTDLNTSQNEQETANKKYIEELGNYWIYYYNIRKESLYDYINKTNISKEFDSIVK